MNKKELVQEIKDKVGGGISAKQVDEILTTAFDIIKSEAHVGIVRIYGFGSFKMVTKSARLGRNPKTGQPIAIPERQELKFKASV